MSEYQIKIRPADGGFILSLEKQIYDGGLASITTGGRIKQYEYICTSMDDLCAKLRAICASQK